MTEKLKRWDIVMAEFGQDYDETNLMQGYRPAIVFSRDRYNLFSPVIFLVPLTKQLKGIDRDYHVFVDKRDCIGYAGSGMALVEQMRPVDRTFVKRRIGEVSEQRLRDKLEEAAVRFLGMKEK